MPSINQEKKDIIKIKGNVLVTANPGTGKTLLLAHRYLRLIEEGVSPENILCLTFTEKAKGEMEEGIGKLVGNRVDPSKMNIFTFHAFAFSYLDSDRLISQNLLRYSILKLVKEKKMLNYEDDYLTETIVPKMENLIRYLKSFGVMPDDINLEQAKALVKPRARYSREEIEKFAEYFVEAFRQYEKAKQGKGIDFADMLIEFLKMPGLPVFDYVLVDELQDVNVMEADIALRSGKKFLAVGDKKQAIFGFQGGSILNFEKFQDSEHRILSENFRSTNEILSYAREFFCRHTKNLSHARELENLRNNEAEPGDKPVVFEVSKKDSVSAACTWAAGLAKQEQEVAVIARTNHQIAAIGKELKSRGIEFSSMFFSASKEAKDNIIFFIKGVLSSDIADVKKAMLTPFFPCALQDAFEICRENNLTLERIYEKCPEFRSLRESVSTIEDASRLFLEKVFPVCVAYGKEYMFAASSMYNSFQEAVAVLDEPSLDSLVNFLKSSDLNANEPGEEKQVILTTVHKAKGREFDAVIYLPTRAGRESFQDDVVKAILKTKGIDAEEELEEESLRVDFVAMTRAKKRLFIFTEKANDYLNGFSESKSFEAEAGRKTSFSESAKRAYSLFLNGDFDRARKLLSSEDKPWLINYVKCYFEGLKKLSFSCLSDKAFDHLKDRILNLKEGKKELSLGSRVHAIASKACKGEEFEAEPELEPYIKNLNELIESIKERFPEVVNTEERFSVRLKDLVGAETDIIFSGFVDAVFRNRDSYLIVDWKTDKSENYASKHRQQLEAYRHAYSIVHNIPIEKIEVAIGFCALRPRISIGTIGCRLDDRKPSKSAFETFSKKAEQVLSWKQDFMLFFEQLAEEECDDILWRSVVEQFGKERED
ncbi:MAG TPA: ATP-dependent helicase [Candidatus Woesearchaeota archaeon]|nr:ATP-dependent helicase [Candidatus Woesearchaeota archaeon]